MMTCTRCKEVKADEQFSFRSPGLRRNTCKTCTNAYSRAHYQRNPKVYAMKARRWTRANHELNRENLAAYLYEHPCVDCGEADIEVLELDHRDASLKEFNISAGMESMSWPRLLAEIEKCDSRCANCHRRRTNRQFGYWRSRLASTIGRAPVS